MTYASSDAVEADHAQGSMSTALATVVYRSKAVNPLLDGDMQCLVQAAQSRNRREAITGLMLYDDSRIFQWLEGPVDGVARVMHSIVGDPRHADLEILSQRNASTRRFKGWDMKLAAPGAKTFEGRDEVIEPPLNIIQDLRRQPKAAPRLLTKLIPSSIAAMQDNRRQATPLVRTTLGKASAAVLKSVIVTSVIPILRRQHGLTATDHTLLAANPRADELADLLLASDEVASLDLIRELRGKDGDVRQLFAPLFEPAARRLGDLWDEDICSEFELTLGLGRLQTAVRLLNADMPWVAPYAGMQPNVLIVPVPGETHHLVASFDSEWLWKSGWTPQVEFPSNDRALEELLSARWIDVLDLSLSAAFRRADLLPHLGMTIAYARRASLNPDLTVIVGGRSFVEDKATSQDVGADMASRTSQNLDQVMLHSLRRNDLAGMAASRNVGTYERVPQHFL